MTKWQIIGDVQIARIQQFIERAWQIIGDVQITRIAVMPPVIPPDDEEEETKIPWLPIIIGGTAIVALVATQSKTLTK